MEFEPPEMQSPPDYGLLQRWDNHWDDRETYDLIFDAGIWLIAQEENEEGALLLAVINSWEKQARSVPIVVLSKALDMARAVLERKAMADALRPLFLEGTPEVGI